jgi:putative membrane protein
VKKPLKDFFAIVVSLWLLIEFVDGVKISGDLKTFLIAAAGLYLLLFLVKPIVKLVLLPLNILTLHLLGLVLNIGFLFVLTKLVPQFSVSPFNFQGYTYQGFTVPAVEIGKVFVFIISGLVITLVSSLLRWFLN